MSESVVVKPVKYVFVWRPLLIMFVVVGLLCAMASMMAWGLEAGLVMTLAPAAFFVVLMVYTYLDMMAAYQKTSYEIQADRIVHHTGGLFSDNTTNLPFRNVTQVEMKLPYLEFTFFKTGHLAIHAAGSAAGKVDLHSIAVPEEIYEVLLGRLEQNGFELRREALIQREKPGVVGVVADVLGGKGSPLSGVVGLAVGGVVLLPVLLTELTSMGLGVPAVFVGAMALMGLPVLLVVVGIDMLKRTYSLYKGMVRYDDGFLTKRKKIIPIANLADTNIDSPLMKRVFGLADMSISCQGASGDILFPSMPNAAKFRNALDRLIEVTDQPRESTLMAGLMTGGVEGAREAGATTEETARALGGQRVEAPQIVATRAPVREYKMDAMREGIGMIAMTLVLAMLTSVAFSFVSSPGGVVMALGVGGIGGLVAAIKMAFAYFTITYTLGSNSVVWVQDMITNRKQIEFTNDKITTVNVRRNPVDRMMNTLTVEFHSIGSFQPIVFRHLKDHQNVFLELHRRFGLPAGDGREVFVPRVGVKEVAAKNILTCFFYAPFSLVVALVAWLATESIVVGAVGFVAIWLMAVWRVAYDFLHAPKCRLNLYEHHVMVRSGLLTHRYSYVPYHQAKNVWSQKYPGQDVGTVTVEAGGSSARAKISYLPEPFAVHDRLDAILYERPMRDVHQNSAFETRTLGKWMPVSKNSMVSSTVTLGLMIVTIPVIPVALYLTKLYYEKALCSLQEDRICQWRGIFFQRFSTVMINRIDQIQTRRGLLHNLFKNGQVEVFTVGSGRAELSLGPHENYQEIYEAINSRANR